MRILFVGRADWANVSNRVARAMNTAADETVARVCTLDRHPSGYQEDMIVVRGTHRELFDAASSADWLISTGDGDYAVFEMLRRFLPLRKDARFATCHVGSAYRRAHAEYDRVDREMGFHARFIGGDLFRFAKDDPRAVPYFAPPDANAIYPWLPDVPCAISHSPTNRVAKGTDVIKAVLDEFSDRATVDIIEGVSYQECIKRRGRTAIFVDQINPDYAGFGASAVEAMAQGCVVLCNLDNLDPEVWTFYPKPPIIEARNADELRERLRELLADPQVLHRHRQASLDWIQGAAAPHPLADYWFRQLRRLGELPLPASAPRVQMVSTSAPAPDQTIAVQMVVRDDAAGLDRSIRSVIDQVDEVVIGIDARSDEATGIKAAQLAREFPDKQFMVYEFNSTDLGMTAEAWAADEFDFAAARNLNLSKIRGTWVFIIDSDEVLVPGADLRALVRGAGDARGFVMSVDLDGTAHVSTRLARRDSFVYERATHNHMALVGARREVLDITIRQDTSIRSEERQRWRDEQRDRAVLKLRTEAEKGEMGALFHLAKHHLTEDRIEEAERLTEDYRLRALPRGEQADERFWLAIGCATIYYNLNKFDKAELWAVRSLFDGPRAEALCLLGDIAESRDDLHEAHAWYEAACALPELRPSKFNLRVITDIRRGRLAGLREVLGLPSPASL